MINGNSREDVKVPAPVFPFDRDEREPVADPVSLLMALDVENVSGLE
tara:strand:- start:5 stop:145 length:141 start_codon:yes stop_codon:yes gene_type:complete